MVDSTLDPGDPQPTTKPRTTIARAPRISGDGIRYLSG
jgi:hypothetical protein